MKKLLKKIMIVLLAGFVFAACSEDLLNTSPSNAIGSSELSKDPAALKALLKGTYKYMQQFGTGGYLTFTGQHDDSGIISFMLTQDILGIDIIAGNGGWYTFVYQHYPSQRYSNHRRATFWWNTSYGIIKNCNTIIASAEGNTTPEFLNITAQAKTLRALAYYNLVRQYRKTYRLGAEGPGVPLVLAPPVGDPTLDSKPAGKLKDVFTQIEADLNWAITNLSATRDHKGMININVAQGVLARVLLEKAYGTEESAKFDQVITLAQAARTGYALMTGDQYQLGFNTVDNAEWIWGHKQDKEGNVSYPGFYSFYDVKKSGRTGYQNFLADTVFVKLFNANDKRKLFEWSNTGATSIYKFIINKFKDKPDFTGDLPYMRAAEMYLIEAEALVNKGMYPEAQTLLDQLRAKRITGYTNEAALTDKNAMLERIWVERRKELYGEGFATSDIMRFGFFLGGTDKVKRGPYHLSHSNEMKDIPADNDKRYLRQIPDLEFESNKSMDPIADQTER